MDKTIASELAFPFSHMGTVSTSEAAVAAGLAGFAAMLARSATGDAQEGKVKKGAKAVGWGLLAFAAVGAVGLAFSPMVSFVYSVLTLEYLESDKVAMNSERAFYKLKNSVLNVNTVLNNSLHTLTNKPSLPGIEKLDDAVYNDIIRFKSEKNLTAVVLELKLADNILSFKNWLNK